MQIRFKNIFDKPSKPLYNDKFDKEDVLCNYTDFKLNLLISKNKEDILSFKEWLISSYPANLELNNFKSTEDLSHYITAGRPTILFIKIEELDFDMLEMIRHIITVNCYVHFYVIKEEMNADPSQNEYKNIWSVGRYITLIDNSLKPCEISYKFKKSDN